MSSLYRAKTKGPPAVAATAKVGLWNMERVHGSHSPADHSAQSFPADFSFHQPSVGPRTILAIEEDFAKKPTFQPKLAHAGPYFPVKPVLSAKSGDKLWLKYLATKNLQHNQQANV